MAVTAQDLVRREVHYCVSSLVSTLAQNCAAVTCNGDAGRDLCDLAEQAQELAAPIEDWEEAAREAGWDNFDPPAQGSTVARKATDAEMAEDASGPLTYAHDWQDACNVDRIEPYDREVFEHWIVSPWLGRKLEAKGEKVDFDFTGLCIWARTTTGQAIYADWVIEQIAAELNEGRSE